ncbi:hypothetical protein GOODEAATRI_002803 [Goodea atripinnis]|uniref:Uncharacterized protein n=1 Tax=Goodea atripinnis TaxID=208336 RepID=A0ABV0PKA9_9TELE
MMAARYRQEVCKAMRTNKVIQRMDQLEEEASAVDGSVRPDMSWFQPPLANSPHNVKDTFSRLDASDSVWLLVSIRACQGDAYLCCQPQEKWIFHYKSTPLIFILSSVQQSGFFQLHLSD